MRLKCLLVGKEDEAVSGEASDVMSKEREAIEAAHRRLWEMLGGHIGPKSPRFEDVYQLAADEITRLRAEKAEMVEALNQSLDANREIPASRDMLGRLVREAWIKWAETQPDPKASWLVPYDDLNKADKEADRQIGETIARWTLLFDASIRAQAEPHDSEGDAS